MNGRGDAIVGWQGPTGPSENSDKAEAVTRVAGGPFTAPQRLTSGYALTPTVSVNEQGAAFAVWRIYDANLMSQLWAASGSASSGLGPGQPVSDPARYPTTVAIDGSGNAIAVWGDQDSRQVLAAWRPAGQSFEPPRALDSQAGGPAVIFDGRGAAIVAWTRRSTVLVSVRAADGTWSVPQVISDPAHLANGAPVMTRNRRGDVLAAWPTSVGEGTYPFSGSVEMSLRLAGGAFGPPRTLTAGRPLLDPQPALDENANALLVWQGASGLMGAYARAGRGLSPAQPIPGHMLASYAAGFDATGAALVASIGNGNDRIRRVIVSGGKIGHPFSPGETIFQSHQPPFVFLGQSVTVANQGPLRLGFDTAGRGVAVWATQLEGQVFAADYRGGAGPPVVEAASVAAPAEGRPRLRYRLSRAASVEIKLDRCHGRGVAKCVNHRRVRRISASGREGTNSTSLSPGRRRRLAQGQYRAVLTARSRGRRAETRNVLFRVTRSS